MIEICNSSSMFPETLCNPAQDTIKLLPQSMVPLDTDREGAKYRINVGRVRAPCSRQLCLISAYHCVHLTCTSGYKTAVKSSLIDMFMLCSAGAFNYWREIWCFIIIGRNNLVVYYVKVAQCGVLMWCFHIKRGTAKWFRRPLGK